MNKSLPTQLKVNPLSYGHFAIVKMATVILLFSCLLSVASQGVVGDKVYTVVANQSASSCPGNQTECSLMYYAAHPDEYLREDNTTFHFLPGHHQLVNSTLVLMANISNLTLYGTDVNESAVVCNGESSGGFSFHSIANLTIMNLTIFDCSHWSFDSSVLIAVEIIETYNLTIYNMVIKETAGVGLQLIDVYGNTVIDHMTIESSHSTSKSKGGNFAYHCNHSNSTIINMIISNSFIRNGSNTYKEKAESSGILIDYNFCSATVSIVLDNVYLENNCGQSGGNIMIDLGDLSVMWSISISILNSWIINGTANTGGGLYMVAMDLGYDGVRRKYPNNILRIYNTHFINNTAYYNGGAVYLRLHQNKPIALGRIIFNQTTFSHNRLLYHSDAIEHGGVGVHIVTYSLPGYEQHKTIFFKISFSDCLLQQNILQQSEHDDSASRPRTGALYTENCQSITLMNCTFNNNNCSGIVGLHSNFLIHGKNEIRGNTAEKGGGIFFCSGSMMHLHNGTQLYITNNNATLSGGGIYVGSECSPATGTCFYQLDNATADNATLHQTQVYLINNIANAGSAIFGGQIDECFLFARHKVIPSNIFNAIFNIKGSKGDLSVISSDPMYVGFCKINSSTTELNVMNCPLHTNVQVKPGQTFSVSAVIMGQRYGLVSGVVVATCDNCKINEYSQFINTSNGQLNFTVFSKQNRNVSLKLVAEDYYHGPSYRYQPSYINIIVERCPLGFIEDNSKCSCLDDLPCNITSQTIHRSSPQWIGYTHECHIDNSTALIMHPFCPLAYCLGKNVHINAAVDCFYQDVQCAKHRTGLLCGKCKQSYSLGFGSSQCLPGCHTAHRYLQYLRVIGLVAVCAVAGILLVVLLTLLNLTVAEGTLNGLIFYANIVQVNLDLFFPSDTHARPWTTFIAWLNLDFGVTVCFYDGMDAYMKTWLQFIFPLYIWIISGGIVYFSRKSIRIAKLAGRNSVKVLATLFLLSFGKLIRTAIAAGFFTNVKSYDGTINISVWLLNANIHYLHGKHITLFIIACLAGILALFYALILTFIQCLRRAPNSRMCGWVQRLKPLLDAYTGPYKNKYHFWTGFLLLVRIALFISFAVNFNDDPTVYFTLIITVCTFLLIFVAVIQPGIYRNRLVGYLEGLMYLNLIFFSATMMLTGKYNTEHRVFAAYFFGSLALVKFLGIITYHAYKEWIGPLKNCKWFFKNISAGNHGGLLVEPVLIQNRDSEDSFEEEEEDNNERGVNNRRCLPPDY